MSKNVFRPAEVVNLTNKVMIETPEEEVIEAAKEELVEEYTGPTADDLRREAEAFKQSWEAEKTEMVGAANQEAEKIIKDAEKVAFDEVQKRTEQAQKTKEEAEEEAQKILADARREADQIVANAQAQVDEIEKDAYDKGYSEGSEKGYSEGNAEVERLIQQLHQIINRSIEKRNEIIEESETQLINLVLLISKKVVKVISENQKNVVINNVIQALRKLKSRGDVVIRVNLDDVKLSSEHVKDFMRMVENVKSITVLEDSSVDRGGCIIETDFGHIDARIASQLKEVEEKIIEMVPIKSKIE
jgi:flagellar assembly protein FliH